MMVQTGPWAWLNFRKPLRILEAQKCSDVMPLLKELTAEAGRGRVAAGFLTYEAAPAMDRAFRTHARRGAIPLAWFGIFERGDATTELSCDDGRFTLGNLAVSVSEREYADAIDIIKGYIGAGDTYQVNFTIRLTAPFEGSPSGLFRTLCRAQMGSNSAFVETEEWAVCSASPELFFSLEGDVLTSMPMKGTSARGLTLEADIEAIEALRFSAKNRAENIMIVDMMRNDMGRCARAGSVHVARTFDVERYPTVLQMTSTVRSLTDAPFHDIVAALFPCASVTGAPKVRTMEIIEEVEKGPRGVYTGAVGFVGPGRRARFNVAIRTMAVDCKAGCAEYGVGGGIVWDSDAQDEYRECLAKARILVEPRPDFGLLETMKWSRKDGFVLGDLHLDRMQASAEYFGYVFDRDAVASALRECAAGFRGEDMRVRLIVDRGGRVTCEADVLKPMPSPMRVGFASAPVTTRDVFLYHKTTNREVYKRAMESCHGVDDVVLFNERGEITESTLANVVADLGGRLMTPPVSSGLLAGTYRKKMIESGEVIEKLISVDDLRKADRIWLVNSVRGRMPAVIVD